ncbi:adenylyl-sulfate kinase [Crocinitomix catalasitica]|uniref:adenylyl-sulfate kinase n=1 Tax=Crocinitomix catalasitica TaxID=184607 RepID=UPI00068545CA|nr:adenylyl-sulfate kinase [Crocinitomix catalasitica]
MNSIEAKVFWFTGLSGAGKTTIATNIGSTFKENYNYTFNLLDGDILRVGLCGDLGFSVEDRKENIRRVAEVAKLFLNRNISSLCTFISPTNEIRDLAKAIIGEKNFVEIYINTPLTICENRDTKGLYKKVRAGEIKNFTGIDAVYESPISPDYILNCYDNTVQDSLDEINSFIALKLKLPVNGDQ